MKILIAGASGWIAKGLGIELVKRGHSLVCLVRDISSAKIQCPFPAQYIEWKNVDSPFDDSLLSEVDAIINLLGESIASKRWDINVKKQILNSRIHSTQHLVNFANKHQLKCFINASAIGFYGNRADENLNENSNVGSGFLAEVCQDWEEKLFSISSTCRCVALRIGVVLGFDGGALEKLIPTFRYGFGGPIGQGTQWMSWIHILDLQNLIIQILENGNFKGPINATAPEPVTQNDFSKALGKSLIRPSFFRTPKFILKLLLGEMSEFILSSLKVFPEKALKLGFVFKYNNINDALNDLVKKNNFFEKNLIVQQYIEKPIEEVFSFYANEYNLELITPSFLNFKVIDKNTAIIQENSLINYKLSLHGIPIKWQSKILEWNPPSSFVDTQTKGPYKKWHHKHKFESLGFGTLISDHVVYKLPFGFMGYLFAGWKVNSDIKEIFSYRSKIIFKYFKNKI